MDKVRIGLVGAGLFGESHLQAFRAVREARIAAVFDTNRERAEQRAREFGIERVCGSLDELCALPDLDAVDVVTPEDDHLEPVLKAFAAGKHVFLEKPMATSLADCRRMIDASQQAGRQFMVGHLLRCETKYAMIKDDLDAGRLGRLVSMHARRNRPKSLLPTYGRTHPAMENSIHDIDLMLWYAGQPVERVRGFGRRGLPESKHPDTFFGVLEFRGGAIGIVETIWLTPAGSGVFLNDAFQLVGTGGVADLRLYPGSLSFLRDTGHEVPDIGYDPRVQGSARGALRDELQHFCHCVLDGMPSPVLLPQQAMQAVQVALALIESGEKGQDVVLQDPAHAAH